MNKLHVITRGFSRSASFNAIKTVTVVGGGLMGSGIAQVAAQAGQDVVLVDVKPEILENAQKSISSNLSRVAKKLYKDDGAKIESFVKNATSKIKVSTKLEDGAKVDLIVEAIVEKLDIKQELFSKLDQISPEHTIFASNTSSISINEIATSVKRKDRFGGLHFFNPVPVMRLLEVIKGDHISESTYQAMMEWGASIGKTCITCKDTPGFVVNRLLGPYFSEAARMLERGDATKEDIDTAMKLGIGVPMGPLELQDFTGLDTNVYAGAVMYEKTGNPVFRPIPLMMKLVEEGKLGRKTGEGFYKYTKMSDVCEKPKRQPLRRQRSIYQVHYSLLPNPAAVTPMSGPNTLSAFGLQVAGHRGGADEEYKGLLQSGDDRVLKPLLKPTELEFYQRLATTNDPDLLELRSFVPHYHGATTITYAGVRQQYIMLEDLTRGMLEPCIMDVKIGRETWDHLATPEKIAREQSKYRLCKQQFGFCIPGYQVYRLATGRLHKYDKEHGKRLHGGMVRSAFRNFANCANGVACRALVVSVLGALWRLQRWAGRPRALRLRTVSVLLLYDAAALRRAKREQPRSVPTRRRSIHSLHNPSGSNLSGLLTSKGPLYPKVNPVPITPLKVYHTSFSEPPPIKSTWSEALDKLNQNHSFEHNYEDKVSKIKMNYRALLDQLARDNRDTNPWGTARLIDFAHTYFHDEEEPTVDEVFKEGIDSLVEIFEEMLRETEDQVF
ncbi:uncharacterized protein LOC121735627 [Aricia agestis]|uniref:uncharacterized protein LOC121735627 n=1 Tax=Aricia agestis TaxID=91739 RepID=UPI001C2095CD|nr:uncharacterized protein LOC121735627 [Aricia agestis]